MFVVLCDMVKRQRAISEEVDINGESSRFHMHERALAFATGTDDGEKQWEFASEQLLNGWTGIEDDEVVINDIQQVVCRLILNSINRLFGRRMSGRLHCLMKKSLQNAKQWCAPLRVQTTPCGRMDMQKNGESENLMHAHVYCSVV